MNGFNPAEAREGFSSHLFLATEKIVNVSIQPKPEKGLVVKVLLFLAI